MSQINFKTTGVRLLKPFGIHHLNQMNLISAKKSSLILTPLRFEFKKSYKMGHFLLKNTPKDLRYKNIFLKLRNIYSIFLKI